MLPPVPTAKVAKTDDDGPMPRSPNLVQLWISTELSTPMLEWTLAQGEYVCLLPPYTMNATLGTRVFRFRQSLKRGTNSMADRSQGVHSSACKTTSCMTKHKRAKHQKQRAEVYYSTRQTGANMCFTDS